GLADCVLVPQLYNARRFGMELARWPVLARIEQACLALPAFAAAVPEAQPDAPRPYDAGGGRAAAPDRNSDEAVADAAGRCAHVRVGVVLAVGALGQAELQRQAVARVGRAQRLLLVDPAFLDHPEQALVEGLHAFL